MKILNLYSGLGGNRKLWPDSVQVTAVEYDGRIAQFYQSQFPNDSIIIGDAIKYLKGHYQEFDFIWASPPCQSHSQYRHRVGVLAKGYCPQEEMMKLKVDNKECYYQVGEKRIYVGVVFKSAHDGGDWYADSYDGSFSADYFTSKPFRSKEEAIQHVDETMKGIFKRILDES